MEGKSRNYRIPVDLLEPYEQWCRVHGVKLTDGPVFAIWLLMQIKDSNEVAKLKKSFYDREKGVVTINRVE